VTDGASLTDACRQAGIYAGRMQEHFRVDPISAYNVRSADERNLNKKGHGGGMPAFELSIGFQI
jgi:hypothetical protein